MRQKEFVIHIVDEDIVHNMNKTAASLAPNESELEVTTLTQIESSHVSVPGVKDAKMRMECVLDRTLKLGEKSTPSCDLINGQVVQFHIKKTANQNGTIDPRELSGASGI